MRAYVATGLAVAGNAGLLARGPARSLGPSLLLILLAGAGLGWLLWEQRQRVLISRTVVLVLSAGLLALAASAPPTESHDVWSYVMYGRIPAVHHGDPYLHPPSAYRDDPFRLHVDPVWRHARSVYGPVFVAMAAGTVKLAGDSPTRARVLFQAQAAVAIALCLLIIDRVTRGDPRALAFIGLNQLVVVTTVNNAHNDAFIGLAALAAVVIAKRRPVFAGALLGLAALIKVAALLPAGVLALWLYRKGMRRAAVLLGGAAGAVTALGYAAAGTAAVQVLGSARERMNRGSLWYPVREVLTNLRTGNHPTAVALHDARDTIGPRLSTLSTVAVLALALLIAYRARRDAPVVVAAAVIAYTVLGAYILPWYMVWGLPLLALAWHTRMAVLAVALDFVLELAYVPDGRRIGLLRGPAIHTWIQRVQTDTRVVVVPLLELAAVVALVVWSARRAGRIELDGGSPGAGQEAPPGDEGQSLDDSAPGELRLPGGPVDESDGNFANDRVH